jgi:protoporphyrinogen oxidase
MKTVILGSGISGVSCSYHLKLSGIESTIYEKDADWGGLCGNFTIDGFRFDRFVHFTFSKDEYTRNTFESSSECFSHKPEASNYYNGTWLRHPAQNNLYPLSVEEKTKIIMSFIDNKDRENNEISNYEEWLKAQYGDFFSEKFPMKYTKKYWTVDANQLETKWVGNRMHKPSIEEVLKGSMQEHKEINYYTNEMRYPKKGG